MTIAEDMCRDNDILAAVNHDLKAGMIRALYELQYAINDIEKTEEPTLGDVRWYIGQRLTDLEAE